MTVHHQVLAGRYEVRELIGRGGMAEVHLGYDTRLNRVVAIKLLRSDIAGDATFQERFRREAQSAAALNHPSIVAVYDSGEEVFTQADGSIKQVPYIVMEYVEGHTVRELLGDGEAVPISEAVEIVTGVLDALEYSHRAGIVHRDIKPGNIMLTSTGMVKVMDFGIARAMEDSAATVTQQHAVVGTAQYLSPEQARGEIVDTRSDLYSTGCLLYELLTGRPPFTGDSAVAIAYQHVREIPKPPSAIAADIPESLDRVVLKALAKSRDDRYQDAAHMRTELAAAARGMSVAAPAVDSWQEADPTTVVQDRKTTATPPTPGPPAPPVPAPHTPSPQAPDEPEPRRYTWVWALLIVLAASTVVVGVLMANGVIGGPGKPTVAPSTGPTAAAVPDVSGKSEDDARKAIEALGLVYAKGSDVASDTIDPGLAVSSEPGAGTSLVVGKTVTVHFSSGSAMVDVPDVSGKSQADARSILTKAGLVVGDVTSEDSPGVKNGDVIRTDPVSGTSVQRGSSVSLVVASGRVTVPGVKGMKEDEASDALRQAGLTVKIVTKATTNQDEDGKVIEVSPEDKTVDSGTTVTITIGAYQAPPSPSLSPTATATTQAAQPKQGGEAPAQPKQPNKP